jgi:hypothetical protein
LRTFPQGRVNNPPPLFKPQPISDNTMHAFAPFYQYG